MAAALSMPVLLVLFLLTITQPYYLVLGPIILGPYRLLLLIVTVPLLVGWLRGQYGRIVLPDLLLLGFTLWIPVSLIANGQAGRVPQYATSQFIDIFSAYLLGRAAVRNIEDFYFLAKAFLILLICLLPFAILESTRGMMILQGTFRGLPNLLVFKPTTLNHGERMGFMRAMTSLEHPILFGVLSSAGISLGLVGLKHAGKGQGIVRRLGLSVGSFGGTFFSMSSGALASAMIQVALIAWDRVLASVRERWHLLIGLFVMFYIVVALVAYRPPLLVLGRMISYKPSTAWNRYMIWQFGSDEVMRHPVFGMGVFTDWIRQSWMPASVDNYWLLMAMRFGLTGIGLLGGMWLVLIWSLTRRDFSNSPACREIRKAYIFTFLGLATAMATVSVWSVSLSMIYLLAGSSVWLLYAGGDGDKAAATANGATPGQRRRTPPARDRGRPDPAPGPDPLPDTAPTDGPRTPRYSRFPNTRGKG